jgi:hypothetical protein
MGLVIACLIGVAIAGTLAAVGVHDWENQNQQQAGQIVSDIRGEHIKVVGLNSSGLVEISYRGCTFAASVSLINGKYYPVRRRTGVVITQANLPRVAAANGCA